MSVASGSGYYLVMRLNAYLPKRTINAAIGETVQRFQYSRATEMQTRSIKEFVTGRDVLVVLPSGSGESLCYAALPYAFDIVGTEWLFLHRTYSCLLHRLSSLGDTH